ncbi:energy-coupling factor transporter transmembrane protein EcfT [Mycoplasma sp. 2045]|uniref:energy-coupling factor transporter transmembrane component T family protein n=1 Tax=Mycoplasma sp. 2045 TaxID=2967301 RepID=UPI00211B9261|nr:energy-coupling factor transporter transmembrane component T [Mycoplasma sp. 2045]UUM20398.1 energy-coupling factor transporter transmembrane protein EcfT [Mycoplasma sp. 2045]
MKSVFGRYIPGDGFLYKLDPRFKLLMVIVYIVMVFMVRYFIDMVILLLPLVIMYIYTNKRVRPLLKMLKLPIFVSVVIFAVNLYTITNETVHNDIANMLSKSYLKDHQDVNRLAQAYWTNGFWSFNTSASKTFYNTIIDTNGVLSVFKGEHSDALIQKVQYGVSLDNINKTLSLFLRIYTMILITTLLTNTTRPILLTKAIEDLLYPLKFIFVPTHVIAMIVSIALRFIPTLIDESNRIIKAQSSRGVDFKHGNIKEKIDAFTTLIIPLFVSSFSKAEDLANSMETRGYDPYAKRTKYRKIKQSWIDLISLLVILAILSFLIVNIVYPNYLPFGYIATRII